MQNKFLLGAMSCILILSIAVTARAQMPRMGLPIPTVLVISKPAPGEIYGNKQVITIGVRDKIYKFILKDAYTNDRRVQWPDIWEQIGVSKPNLQIQGPGEDQFAQIEPGQTYTVNGLCAPLTHTFEVGGMQPGGGSDQKSRY
jgi:hypothetical protein